MEGLTVDFNQLSEDYILVARAIQFLEEHLPEQPGLRELAASVHLSEYHFQRLFTRWVGVSPKRFLQYLTKEQAKEILSRSGDLLNTIFETGLSSPGRLHDLFVTCEAVTPGQFKTRGQGLEIHYGFHPSPFGVCLLGVTRRGISNLIFTEPEGRSQALAELRAYWPKATLIEDQGMIDAIGKSLFSQIVCGGALSWRLYLNGTNFQIKVWEALLRLPAGTLITYEDLAMYIGLPGAARAVGNAVGSNPIPVIIPCHRVIRKSGDLGNYRAGPIRKKLIVGWEQGRFEGRQENLNLAVSL